MMKRLSVTFCPTVLCWCTLLTTAQPAMAQPEEDIVYPKFYTFHLGDDTTWARPDFDDSKWEKVAVGTFPFDRWKGIGWCRFVLEVDSTLLNVPLGLGMWIGGAIDFYLDGERVYRFGIVGTSKEEEQGYYGSINPQIVSFRAAPLGTSRHLVAIRYSRFFMESPVWSGQYSSFGFGMGDMNRMISDRSDFRRKVTTQQMLLTGIFSSFALLHLMLFLFDPRRLTLGAERVHLYFALSCACLALLMYLDGQFLFITNPTYVAWTSSFYRTTLILLLVLAIKFTHLIFSQKSSKIFIIFCTFGLGLCIWAWFEPYLVFTYAMVFYLAAVAELVRTFLAGRKKIYADPIGGLWIIALGLVPALLAGAYEALVGLEIITDLWEKPDFRPSSYGLLCVMISSSVFLSRNYSQTNRNLEAQLVQVKELSEKTVRQEVERARLEAENARKTRELEQARQLQLSMLPKTIPNLPNLEIAVYMQTATEVGGDYYDFHVHDDATLTVAIGDATGHGLHAGTMVAATKSLFNSLADEGEPVQILKKATKALKVMGFHEMYMTLAVAKVKDSRLQIASAGMPFTMVYRAATHSVEEIVLKGMPLGSFPDFPYEQRELYLAAGDTVLFMSDGFPERFNTQGETLGEERAKTIFAEAASRPFDTIIPHLLEEEKAWANGRAQDDDVTFVVLQVKS